MQVIRRVPAQRSYTFECLVSVLFRIVFIAILLIELIPLIPDIRASLPPPSAQSIANSPDLQNLPPSSGETSPAILLQPNAAVAAQTCTDPSTVTSNKDDGSCGTLRNALAAAASTLTKTVTFGLTPGSIIKITPANGGLIVPVGVTIDGGNCAASGTAGYIIYGNGATSPGLTLNGNNTLRKITIGGFTGKQISIPNTAHKNQLQCTISNVKLDVPPPDPSTIVPALDRP